MLKNSILSGWILLSGMLLSAQNIPKIGYDHTIDIANWNLNWFGKTQSGYGPSNDSLQIAIVENVLLVSQVDIWIFSELVDTNSMKSITGKMGHHRLVISRHNQEQKNAILFDTLLFRFCSMKMPGNNDYNHFSTGRFPLQVALLPKKAPANDTLFIIALHLKANTGNDSQKLQAYLSRKQSSDWLAAYLSGFKPEKRILMAGDWNDDLDNSIYNNLPTPLRSCLNLEPGYIFLSKKLTQNNISTTTGFDNPIDHQLVSASLLNYYQNDSTFVWRIDSYISRYSQNCSDHYPVISRISSNLNRINDPENTTIRIYPNPSKGYVNFNAYELLNIELYDMRGKKMEISWNEGQGTLDISEIENGVYCIRLIYENGIYNSTLVMDHE